MRNILTLILLAVLMASASAPAEARVHGGVGIYVGPPVGYYPYHHYYAPYAYGPPYPYVYAPYAYAVPPVIVQSPPPPPYASEETAYCREYHGTMIIGGRRQATYGTACRQPDGTWKLVN